MQSSLFSFFFISIGVDFSRRGKKLNVLIFILCRQSSGSRIMTKTKFLTIRKTNEIILGLFLSYRSSLFLLNCTLFFQKKIIQHNFTKYIGVTWCILHLEYLKHANIGKLFAFSIIWGRELELSFTENSTFKWTWLVSVQICTFHPKTPNK